MRATDRRRERTLAQLRDGYSCGELGTDTFDVRVSHALEVRTSEELRGLTADLPTAGGPLRRARGAVRRAVAPPAPPSSLLTAAGLRGGQLTLGRSSGCELVFADDTVSRRHAALRLRDGRWFLLDLGSSNGTWVNGRRVYETEVLAGDEVRLGAVSFRL